MIESCIKSDVQRHAFVPIRGFDSMRARWVSEQPRPEPETIGRAIIASWWPMTYHWLSTIRLDADSPTLLVEAIRLNRRYEDVQLPTEMYVTNVYRCNRIGVIRGNPLYERQYENLVEAQQGHRETFEALVAGRLKF
jgi:hypothetical protein